MLSNMQERQTLMDWTGAMTDPTYVTRAWIKREPQENDFRFWDVVHFFFDDTHYAEQPEDHLGESLFDAEEVAAVRRMVAAMDTLIEAAPDRVMTDADYLRMPEWPAVHATAKHLNALVAANDARMAAAG